LASSPLVVDVVVIVVDVVVIVVAAHFHN